MRFSSFTLLIATACAGTPPSSPAMEPPAPVVKATAPAASAEARADRAPVEPDAGASSDASRDAEVAPKALAASGTPCSASSECASGICEGAGCEYATGECAEETRSCSAKLAWYCGCDGKDFQASEDCPGRRFAYRARCASAKAWGRGAAPDGAPCLRPSQCKSGVCEGEGCDDAHPGTCQPATRGCGQSAVQYCGCDGRVFSSNPCPGVRYAAPGQCAVDASATSVVRVLSVTGKDAKANDALKAALDGSTRLQRCHLASGEKTLTATIDFEIDGQGRVSVKKTAGLGGPETLLSRCLAGFARATVVAAGAGTAGVTQVSVKLRLELGRAKP